MSDRREALRRQAEARRRQMGLARQTNTTVVAGPPCSGKSTYVTERARPGDLIVDWDALATALTGARTTDPTLTPFVADARDAVLNRLATRTPDVAAWVVTTARGGDLAALVERLGASQVVMDADLDACLTRLHTDPGDRDVDYAREGIHRWFAS